MAYQLDHVMSNPVNTYMLNEPKLIFKGGFLWHTVKWFQVLLGITNISIKHLSFDNSFISNNSVEHKSFACTHCKYQTILFDPLIGFLSGATTSGQSGPGSNGNEEVLCISQSSSITRASLSDCLMSYPGQLFGGGFTDGASLTDWG